MQMLFGYNPVDTGLLQYYMSWISRIENASFGRGTSCLGCHSRPWPAPPDPAVRGCAVGSWRTYW